MERLHLVSRTETEDRYVLSSAERLVRVPDEIRKCVGFTAYNGGSGRLLCGTAFVVGLPMTEDRSARFILTASHILDEVAKRTADGKLHLRFSKRGGGFVWVETALSSWLRHPSNASVDCAVIPLPLPTDADVLVYGFKAPENWLTDETIRRLNVGIGDEVFFPGLFSKHAGIDQNVPTVRGGTIAAMATPSVEGALVLQRRL